MKSPTCAFCNEPLNYDGDCFYSFCSEACFTAFKLCNYSYFTNQIKEFHMHFYYPGNLVCHYFSLEPFSRCDR